jgi:hypothetical protein
MKRRKYITTFGLVVALTGLSPVVAADAGRTPGSERILPDQRQRPLMYKLSYEQMDKVAGGSMLHVIAVAGELFVNEIFNGCSATCMLEKYRNLPK